MHIRGPHCQPAAKVTWTICGMWTRRQGHGCFAIHGASMHSDRVGLGQQEPDGPTAWV